MVKSFQHIKQAASPILKAAGVTRSGLFGSSARGQSHASSDIDLLVDLPHDKSLIDVIDLKLQLETALKQSVDLVEYSTLKPRLRATVLQEQLVII